MIYSTSLKTTEYISKLVMDNEDKLFSAKINDLFSISQNRNIVRFSSFLDEKEQYLAENIAKFKGQEYMLFGGCENAVRKVLGVFPDYMRSHESEFPITAVTAEYKSEYSLTHRDFLGSLMALQIKREAVGDIVVGKGKAVIFLLNKIAPAVMSELIKVGRVGVKLSEGIGNFEMPEQRFESIIGSVCSARLDSVTALLTGISREKAAALIKSGGVCLNYREELSVSRMLCDSDIISIRKYGKYIFRGAVGVSKKNKLRIACDKYV